MSIPQTHTIVIEEGPHSFGAHVEELPGCVAVAKTRTEVERLIREAIRLHLAAADEPARQRTVPGC